MKISIVGFGYVGLTLGCVLANRGHQVVGIDRDQERINQLASGILPIYEPDLDSLFQRVRDQNHLSFTTHFLAVAASDVIIITVGTPLNEVRQPNLKNLRSCIDSIKPYLKHNHLVILKSTVPPGTTETLFSKETVERYNLKIAFCPERLAEGQALKDLERLPIIIGGINQDSTVAAEYFWKLHASVKTICVSNSRTAEMVKLADNLWIDVNIALANELAKLCFKTNIDVLELIKAANTLPKGQHFVNFLLPSIGVGGSCLTKDPWFISELARLHDVEMKIPSLCRSINDAMPEYTVKLLHHYFKKKARPPADTKIAVLGLTFKSDTSDMRFSPVTPIITQLESLGYRIDAYDPLVNVGSLVDVLEDADAVAFFTGHRIFRELSLENLALRVKQDALIFDGRMYFPSSLIHKMQQLGLNYLGVGRESLQSTHSDQPERMEKTETPT